MGYIAFEIHDRKRFVATYAYCNHPRYSARFRADPSARGAKRVRVQPGSFAAEIQGSHSGDRDGRMLRHAAHPAGRSRRFRRRVYDSRAADGDFCCRPRLPAVYGLVDLDKQACQAGQTRSGVIAQEANHVRHVRIAPEPSCHPGHDRRDRDKLARVFGRGQADVYRLHDGGILDLVFCAGFCGENGGERGFRRPDIKRDQQAVRFGHLGRGRLYRVEAVEAGLTRPSFGIGESNGLSSFNAYFFKAYMIK